MLISPKNLTKNTSGVGPKTLNLKVLMDLGLKVPPFLVVASESMELLHKDSQAREELAKEIAKKLPCDSYAVRSSALIEDAEAESFAGQFHTQVNVAQSELAEAIYKVIDQSKTLLSGDLTQFSLLIQEFIEPDYAGVTFTRNPFAEREMVIEYHQGRGEELVSGRVQPKKASFYWHQKSQVDLPALSSSIKAFKQIEAHFKYPQDIEWCIKGQELYFLQTRPITTISPAEYEGIAYLDQHLIKNQEFFYEKNEISEIAPRPTPFTLSLLQKIYAQQGPVSNVYQKKGARYEDLSFLKIVGNELYVDREKELQSLLLSFSHFKKSDLSPAFSSFHGLFTTLKNLFRLAQLKSNPLELGQRLKKALESKVDQKSFRKALSVFLQDYQIIFQVNLSASKAFKAAQRVIKKEKISFAEALSLPEALVSRDGDDLRVDFSAKNLRGNSLEINDDTPFEKAKIITINKTAKEWWETLPAWKQNFLKPFLAQALFWQRAREMGRWLTVKNISSLRQEIVLEAKKANLLPDLLYFSTLGEILGGKIDKKELENRKKKYSDHSLLNLPPRLTGRPIEPKTSGPLGLSPGVVEGVLVDSQTIKQTSGKKILYTKNLSPDLTQYFYQIEGIVSHQGGMLSHLAIVARERGIPVVSQFDLVQAGFKMGDQVLLDGGVGKIESL